MYYQKEAFEVIKEFKTSSKKGLSSKEAQKRILKYGKNIIKKEKKKSLFLRFFSYFLDIFSLLLFVAAFLSLFLGGNTGYRDALVILGIVVLNSTIGFIQEYRAEKIIEALQKILPQRATVLRDGKEISILSEDIVPGDILILEEGDDISADARIISENDLETNDFTLTGESVPQRRFEKVISKKVSLIDINNMVFAGTSVARGNAKVVVTATGMETEFGKIAKFTQKIEEEPSHLQKELSKSGKTITKITIIIDIIILFLNILLGKPFSFSLVFTLSLMVAMVPEGLPVTVSIALALAVKRMAKRNALVKKLSAVETLGSATVICTDKTGTITKGEMTVKEIWFDLEEIHVTGVGYEPKGEFFKNGKKITTISDSLKEFLIGGVLCSNAKLVGPAGENGKCWSVLGDPTEGALLTLAQKAGFSCKDLEFDNRELYEVPFTPERKKMSVLVKNKKGKFVYSKGSPMEILKSCSFIKIKGFLKPIEEYKERIIDKVDEFAKRGLRVLAIASKEFQNNEKVNRANIEKNLIFLGLVAMIDPPKEGVMEAVNLAKKAGIKIIMITGDYSLTAAAIAERVGILDSQKGYSIITGNDLLKMHDQELLKTLKTKDVVFARTTPEQKIRIVSLLKDNKEVVAMTGDGVNDAPALKKADIGVAMGISGTDVSKEAGDIILLDDNFKTIVLAIEEGRRVYDNLKKVIYFVFSANVGQLFSVITSIILNIPLPLLAIQILAIDLGVDIFSSFALAIDPKRKNVMERPPRSQEERLLSRKMIEAFFSVGAIMGIGAAFAFTFIILKDGWFWGRVLEENIYFKATTVTYTSITFSQIVNLFFAHAGRESILRSFFTNKSLIISSLISLILLLSFMHFPLFQSFFYMRPIKISGFLAALSVAFIILIFVKIKSKLEKEVFV